MSLPRKLVTGVASLVLVSLGFGILAACAGRATFNDGEPPPAVVNGDYRLVPSLCQQLDWAGATRIGTLKAQPDPGFEVVMPYRTRQPEVACQEQFADAPATGFSLTVNVLADDAAAAEFYKANLPENIATLPYFTGVDIGDSGWGGYVDVPDGIQFAAAVRAGNAYVTASAVLTAAQIEPYADKTGQKPWLPYEGLSKIFLPLITQALQASHK